MWFMKLFFFVSLCRIFSHFHFRFHSKKKHAREKLSTTTLNLISRNWDSHQARNRKKFTFLIFLHLSTHKNYFSLKNTISIRFFWLIWNFCYFFLFNYFLYFLTYAHTKNYFLLTLKFTEKKFEVARTRDFFLKINSTRRSQHFWTTKWATQWITRHFFGA